MIKNNEGIQFNANDVAYMHRVAQMQNLPIIDRCGDCDKTKCGNSIRFAGVIIIGCEGYHQIR